MDRSQLNKEEKKKRNKYLYMRRSVKDLVPAVDSWRLELLFFPHEGNCIDRSRSDLGYQTATVKKGR